MTSSLSFFRSDSAEKLEILAKKLQSVQDIDELTKMVLREGEKTELFIDPAYTSCPDRSLRFSEAPSCQRVRGEEGDPSSHPEGPGRAAARRVQPPVPMNQAPSHRSDGRVTAVVS